MTLLELVNQILAELGLQTVAGVVGNQEPSVVQVYALMNRLGCDLTREHDWQRLAREHILVTKAEQKSATLSEGSTVAIMADTAGLSERWGVIGDGVRPFTRIISIGGAGVDFNMPADRTGTFDLTLSQVEYPLPLDWKKQSPQTEWDRTNRWPLMGPQTAQSWQSFKSGIVYSGPRERFRIMNNAIALNPPPPDGLVFAYEYIANSWAIGLNGTFKSKFDTDSDTCIYDTSLMVLGAKVLFLQAKGLDFSLEGQQFANLMSQCKAQDKSAPVLSTSVGASGRFLSVDNVPDGSWQ